MSEFAFESKLWKEAVKNTLIWFYLGHFSQVSGHFCVLFVFQGVSLGKWLSLWRSGSVLCNSCDAGLWSSPSAVPQQEWGAGSSCPQCACQVCLVGSHAPGKGVGAPGMPFFPSLFPVLDFQLCSHLCLTWSTFWERGFQMRQSRGPWLECVPGVHVDTVCDSGMGRAVLLGWVSSVGTVLVGVMKLRLLRAWIPSNNGNQRTVPLTFLFSYSGWLSKRNRNVVWRLALSLVTEKAAISGRADWKAPSPVVVGILLEPLAHSVCTWCAFLPSSRFTWAPVLLWTKPHFLVAQRTGQLFCGSGGFCRDMVLLMNSSMLWIYPIFFKLRVTVSYRVVRCILAGHHQH